MLGRMKLGTKLLVTGLFVTMVPMAVNLLVVHRQNGMMEQAAVEECQTLAYADLDHIAEGVYAMCASQQELLQQSINDSLNVARRVLAQTGPVRFAEETVTWTAIDQFTKTEKSVSLPKMMVGDVWLGQNTEAKTASPVVDEVMEVVGATCTIFQRMNEEGDLLRVCTNVCKQDGSRAIGTFIPKLEPGGKANPVVEAILKGQSFQGRTYVVNGWYITAYEPIKDAAGNVVGALYVGVPQESVTSLRQAVMNTKVGETGYVYILDSQGHYVISQNGKRDGENIWEAKDADGVLFIQEICKKALNLGPNEVAEQRYPWKNAGDATARVKVARVMYFAPWDWVIGVGSYVEEFQKAEQQVRQLAKQGTVIQLVVSGAAVFGALLVWFLVARYLTRQIGAAVGRLKETASSVGSASQQVSQATQQIAEGASEQASSLEETSSSLEEMTSMTRKNAENARQANGTAETVGSAAAKSKDAMTRMSEAINKIKASSDQTAKILKTIDEIAFQTNLLALNAAVEAARAGEAGKGFAVVAEEVRNLAQRSAEAARNTAGLIEEAQKNAENGVMVSQEVGDILSEIVTGVGEVGQLIGQVSGASDQQAQGIEQINTAISQMDHVTQSNAANAEETASACESLSSQVRQLNEVVETLVRVIGDTSRGGHAGHPSPSEPSERVHAVAKVKSGVSRRSAFAPAETSSEVDGF